MKRVAQQPTHQPLARAAERVEAQAARREKREPRRVLTAAHERAASAIVEAVTL
jgi:hypothetical protein